MHAQTATIENGFVHLPQAAPWLAAYLHELAVFPHGRFDDQVDSTAQFLDWFKTSAREDGIYAYYRMLAEERRRKLAPAPLTRPGRKAIFWRKICGVARGAPLRGREPASGWPATSSRRLDSCPPCQADRNIAVSPGPMLAFFGKARVVDDPSLDWSAALDRRQHQFTYLASIAASDHGALPTK